MKRLTWLSVMVLGMAACGGASTSLTSSTVAAPPAVQVAGTDLSGLGFEVHQEPG